MKKNVMVDMENGGRRVAMPMASPTAQEAGGGGGAGGGGSYAVLQFVGFSPSPSANWAAASPCPSPRSAGIESPRLRPEPDRAQQQPQPQQVVIPTTFVQADTSTFKEVVQRLTGASDDAQEKKLPITMPARYAPRPPVPANEPEGRPNPTLPPVPAPAPAPPQGQAQAQPVKPGIEVGPRKPAFKLHERRQNLRNLQIGLGINPLRLNLNGRISPRSAPPPEILSPSMLDLPSLVLSPVTPLGSDPFDCPSNSTSCDESSISQEERAIAGKGFYLHPSPLQTPRDREPELLPLFPLQSPRGSSS